MSIFPFVQWFFARPLTGGGITGRILMIAVILFTAYVVFRLEDTKKGKTAVFLVCYVLWLAAELLYHFGKLGAQMVGAFLGIPTLLIWVGMAIGVLCRLLLKRPKQSR